MGSLPRRQRVAAYAVMLREREGRVEILLSRLAPRISPRRAVDAARRRRRPRRGPARRAWCARSTRRPGLDATVGVTGARLQRPPARAPPRDGRLVDSHAIRIVYDAWVPTDAPAPRVVEVDGSTVEAAWHALDDVARAPSRWPSVVTDALVDHQPFRLQRVAAYALVPRSRTRRRGAADPALGARRPPRPLDAARRRRRPR